MEKITYVTYPGNPEAEEKIKGRNVLFIDNDVARQVLTVDDCSAVVEDAYREFGLGRATASRASHYVPRPDGRGWYTWDPMAAAIPKLGVLAIRIKSDVLPPTEGQVKKYCVAPGKFCGLILLFSTEDGAPLAIMNDGHIQHMRVGAVGGLSVKHMACRNASTLGLYGTAGMATAHAFAIAKVRSINTIKVYSPNREHRQAFARQTSQDLGIEVVAVDNPRKVMERTDIVAACTSSLMPVIRGEWMEPGMHVLSVLPNEFDDEVFLRCHRYVYSRTPTTEYYVADPSRTPSLGYEPIDTEWLQREQRLLTEEKKAFLSDVILGKRVGRASNDEITCFTTQGIPIQFTATAYKVYQLANERGLGRKLPLSWFLQSLSD